MFIWVTPLLLNYDIFFTVNIAPAIFYKSGKNQYEKNKTKQKNMWLSSTDMTDKYTESM